MFGVHSFVRSVQILDVALAMTKVIGLDLALNHAAAVELTDGKPTWWAFISDSAGVCDRGKAHATRLQLPSSVKDRQQRQMLRLAQLEHWLDKTVLIARQPDFVGIEDYAIRAEHQAHYMGELGGIARILTWFRGIPFRLHDPISVKMFAAHDGTAQKDAVERAMKERFPELPFDDYNLPGKAGKQQNRTTSEDLYDASALALLTWTEYQLRHGLLAMSKLHAKEIQVFNRITKTYPLSLLSREWILNPGGSATPHSGLQTRIEKKIQELEVKGATAAANLLKDLLREA